MTATPLHHQELLKQYDLSYDPYGLMPRAFPERPRALCTGADILRVRQWAKEHEWVRLSVERLLANADKPFDLPASLLDLPAGQEARKIINPMINHVERNALAFALFGREQHRAQALAALRLLARDFEKLPIVGGGKLCGGGLSEAHQTYHLARACDLLESTGLEEADRAAIHAMLRGQYLSMDNGSHRTCGNHSTWTIAGRVALAVVLGDLRGLHDSLYGCPAPPVPNSPDTPTWRYGLVHQLRHDIFSDGYHWERTPGYHFYTLMGFVEIAALLSHVGVDVWHLQLPAASESEGYDIHRAYDAAGHKCFKAAFDAPLYWAFNNGDMSGLHDSGLPNYRGIPVWGVVYDLAYEAYGDPRYAWLLNYFERETRKREIPGIPMPLQTTRGDVDFVRRRTAIYPVGTFSLAQDTDISLTGRHRRGCSLFPVHGSAVLRSDTADVESPGAALYWGPHNAGHQSPAALHLDLHAQGRMLTTTPASHGYEDPTYLFWRRTTIGHNTVTVDRKPMFPYDLDGESIWEADLWRGRVSDGVLELFQPEKDFSAIRASNQNVYPGVRLDRTVVLTNRYVIDAYRVFSDAEHDYDWAMHFHGSLSHGCTTSPIDLGDGRGYRFLTEPAALGLAGAQADLVLTTSGKKTHGRLFAPPGGTVVVCKEHGDTEVELGEVEALAERACALIRMRAASTLFVAFWQFGGAPSLSARLLGPAAANAPVEVEVAAGKERTIWHLPRQAMRVRKA